MMLLDFGIDMARRAKPLDRRTGFVLHGIAHLVGLNLVAAKVSQLGQTKGPSASFR